jgi:hypothetical protein
MVRTDRGLNFGPRNRRIESYVERLSTIATTLQRYNAATTWCLNLHLSSSSFPSHLLGAPGLTTGLPITSDCPCRDTSSTTTSSSTYSSQRIPLFLHHSFTNVDSDYDTPSSANHGSTHGSIPSAPHGYHTRGNRISSRYRYSSR